MKKYQEDFMLKSKINKTIKTTVIRKELDIKDYQKIKENYV